MTERWMERRKFLKTAAQGAMAAPMLAMLPGVGEAQEAKKAAGAAPVHKAAVAQAGRRRS